MVQLYKEDCFNIFTKLRDGSVDMILCDLPFGMTNAGWDIAVNLKNLWEHYARIIKTNGAIVLHSSQPFTSDLVCSKKDWFRCEWIWDKKNPTNFANAKHHPMKTHESILVFGKGKTVYYPIMQQGEKNHSRGKRLNSGKSDLFHADPKYSTDNSSGMKYPKSIVCFPKHSSQCGHHPTQKPIKLLEYLIQTYTLEGETVLDNTMGSGSTGVACVNTNRNFIGIELDEKYFEIAKKRIDDAVAEKKNSLFS